MDWENEIESTKELTKEQLLGKVSLKLAAKQSEAQMILDLIEKHEEQIKNLKNQFATITEEEMPQIMDEIGFPSITLPTGEVIEVDREYYCGIPKKFEDEAHQWLRDNNLGEIIKNEIVVKATKGQDEFVSQIEDRLKQFGLAYTRRQSVNAQTLKATVKEQQRQKNPLPSELFGIYEKRVVKVKKKG